MCGSGCLPQLPAKAPQEKVYKDEHRCDLVIGLIVQGSPWPGLEICPLIFAISDPRMRHRHFRPAITISKGMMEEINPNFQIVASEMGEGVACMREKWYLTPVASK